MKPRKPLEWHLCHDRSEYRRVKRVVSNRYLGVPSRGRRIQTVKIPQEVMANLVGVGVAEKRAARESCGAPSITFYVQRKLPKARLTRRLLLPRTIDGLTCDVVACGNMRPAAGGSPSDPLDPLTPGAQIQVQGANRGTLGGFVRDANGDVCMISNAHVLSSDLASARGQTVFQPAFGFPGSRSVGTVTTVVPISADGRNTVDLALAKLDTSIGFDPTIPAGIGAITGAGRPSRTQPVAKFGQATLDTRGIFDSIDADVVVPYDFMSATFTNVCVFRPGSFADDGDSGSLVVEPRTGRVVGLIFATSSLLNFAISTAAIEDALPGLTWL